MSYYFSLGRCLETMDVPLSDNCSMNTTHLELEILTRDLEFMKRHVVLIEMLSQYRTISPMIEYKVIRIQVSQSRKWSGKTRNLI